jgi:DNA-binding MarR family transcriptional regulator
MRDITMSNDPHFIRALATALDTDPDATVSARNIASQLGMDETTTRQTVARLKREGLIEPRPGPRKAAHNHVNEPLALTREGWTAAAELKKD